MLATSKTTSDLIKARELIADKEHWTTCTYRRCNAINDTVSYCAVGALLEVFGLGQWPIVIDQQTLREKLPALRLLETVAMELFPVCSHTPSRVVEAVNDALGFDAVHRLYDRAIEKSMMEDSSEG